MEDFALGFQQQAVKLFLLGKTDQKLFSFFQKSKNLGFGKNNRLDSSDSDSDNSDSDNESEEEQEMAIISQPTAIQFPKFSPLIT